MEGGAGGGRGGEREEGEGKGEGMLQDSWGFLTILENSSRSLRILEEFWALWKPRKFRGFKTCSKRAFSMQPQTLFGALMWKYRIWVIFVDPKKGKCVFGDVVVEAIPPGGMVWTTRSRFVRPYGTRPLKIFGYTIEEEKWPGSGWPPLTTIYIKIQ
jgi:hypothetical protein